MPRNFHRRPAPAPSRKKRGGFSAAPALAGLGLLVAALGAGYLVVVNVVSSRGYQIRTLEQEIAALKEESARLELKVAQEQAVQAVEQKVQTLGMVPTQKIEYLTFTAPTVATR